MICFHRTKFQTQFETLIYSKSHQKPSKILPKKIAVVGGGAAGCELALALITRWKTETGTAPEISLITDKDRLMPQMAPKAGNLVDKKLRESGNSVKVGHSNAA